MAPKGNVEIVKLLADLTVHPNAPGPDGMTPILWAVILGQEHTEKIVRILAPLANNPNEGSLDGDTPILVAASRGNVEVVKLLAPLCSNPNAPHPVKGVTPIFMAATLGQLAEYFWAFGLI